MRPVSVGKAKQIAESCDARGCVVLTFDEFAFGITSYGRTKKECKAMQSFGDHLALLLDSESLEPWPDEC